MYNSFVHDREIKPSYRTQYCTRSHFVNFKIFGNAKKSRRYKTQILVKAKT